MSSSDEACTKQADYRDIDTPLATTYLDFHPITHRAEGYKSLISYDRKALASRIHALFAQAYKDNGLSYRGGNPSFQEKKSLLLILADACAIEGQIDAAWTESSCLARSIPTSELRQSASPPSNAVTTARFADLTAWSSGESPRRAGRKRPCRLMRRNVGQSKLI